MQIPGLGSLFGTQYALLVGFQFRPGTALQKFCPDFTLRGWRGQEFRVRALRGLFYNFVYLWWRQMPGWSTGSGTQEMKETVGWRVLINQIRRVGYMFIAPPPPPPPRSRYTGHVWVAPTLGLPPPPPLKKPYWVSVQMACPHEKRQHAALGNTHPVTGGKYL